MEKSYLLKYDEWVVPGEVEYAERKAGEIEAQLERHNKKYKNSCVYWEADMDIQLTEHIVGIFVIKYPSDLWMDYDVTDEMLIGYFKKMGGCVDEPKIFGLPADDVRNNLPEWDDSLIPDTSWRDIMGKHSIRYMAAVAIKSFDGDYDKIKRKFNLDDAKCSRIMETFIKKLETQNKKIIFTEIEEKIADYIKYEVHDNYCCYYEPWYFPITMSEKDIIDAIREVYFNVSIKSRRRIPDKLDRTNISYWSHYRDCRIENYECLYQGKAGDMIIRFLFDFKNMKIVMAYPVYKARKNQHYRYKENDSFADMAISNAPRDA